MARLERLVNLMNALIETDRPLTRTDIRDRVPGYTGEGESFRRAFERDKDTLRQMGVPVVVEPVAHGNDEAGEGYRIPRERYQLPDPGLTREEMDALALAASSAKLRGDAATSALWKLGADTDREPIGEVALADDDRLATFFLARRERSTTTFAYRGKQRRVDPHRLSFRNGHWYVTGHDHDADEARTYRLDRIEAGPELSAPGAFAAPPPTSQHWYPAWRMGEGAPVTAVVRFDPGHADLLVGSAEPDAIVERRDDGSLDAAFEVTNQDAFLSFVLGFLDHAEVLAPDELRQLVVDHLTDLAELS